MAVRFHNVYWLWLSALIIAVDQISKQLVVREMLLFERIPLLPHLNLFHAHNTGAAFSLFNTAPALMFIALGLAVSAGILWWMRRHPYEDRLAAVGLALILGGALGNVIDRATRGFVIDFIDFYVGDWHFPAFNVADIGISVGAGLLILDTVLQARREARARRETA